MDGPLQLRRGSVNRLGERQGVMAHLGELEAPRIGFHTAAHVAVTGPVRGTLAQMNLNARDPLLKTIQRAFDHTLDPNHQLLAAIDVVVDFDPDLHLGTQNRSLKCNVAKNMPPSHPPFGGPQLPPLIEKRKTGTKDDND